MRTKRSESSDLVEMMSTAMASKKLAEVEVVRWPAKLRQCLLVSLVVSNNILADFRANGCKPRGAMLLSSLDRRVSS